jgi:type II secretory pathway component PulF
MSFYHYRAYNAAGQSVSGSLEAESPLALEGRLRGMGIWLLDAREGLLVAREQGSRFKIKRSELINFLTQLSLLLRAGITLPNALERLAEDLEGSRPGLVVSSLRDQVVSGIPLHQAMAAYPRVFSAETTAIVQAGEISGKLPDAFENLASYSEWLDGLLGEVRQALIYPIVVLGASLSLVLLLFTFVVPKFTALLTELSLQVPLLTRTVMAISHALIVGWPGLLLLLIGVPAGLKLAMRSPSFGFAFDRALLRLPIFGRLVAMFALSRFTHNLGLLYRAGIPLVRGLEICFGVAGNRALARAIDDARQGVLEGTPLSKCLAVHEIFPRTMVTMVATGESSGTLDFALQSVAGYYNKVIPRQIKIIFAIFDPVMMLSLIAVVGVVALAVILPILELWGVR